MRINEHLKFSWGHIIAFLAIIFICYISFLGLSYLTEGQFGLTGIGVSVIAVMILSVFIGAQVLKASDHHFKRRIHFERALVFLSPVVLMVVLLPFFHFWNVYDNKDKIETNFSNTIRDAKQLFDVYENYSNDRISELDQRLSTSKNQIHRNNVVEALSLQLLGDNYNKLRSASCDWISTASEATVWNVFMIGNIATITDAFTMWNQQLVDFSSKELREESNVIRFDASGENVRNISKGFVSIQGMYSKMRMPNSYAYIWLLFLYVCLFLPYLIQDRHTKSTRGLFRNEGANNIVSHAKKQKAESITESDVIPMQDVHSSNIDVVVSYPEPQGKKNAKVEKEIEEEVEDYGSFTM